MGNSIAQWHMSTATFGRPNFGLTQTTGDQFFRGIGNVGSGQYKAYNPSDGYPVQVTWEMDGPTFTSFLTAWNTGGQLRAGANWFSLDLPLMLDYREQVGTDYVEVRLPFSVLVEVNGADDQVGYRASANIGDIQPKHFAGKMLHRMSVATAFDTFTTQFFGDTQLPPPNDATFQVDTRIEGEPLLMSSWNGTNAYRVSNLSTFSTLETVWRNNAGTQQEVHLVLQMPREQRYVCHFVDTYTAQKMGFDMWRVTAQIEIDTSPEPYIA